MKKWEYSQFSLASDNGGYGVSNSGELTFLNELGRDGWELIETSRSPAWFSYLMKREISEQSETPKNPFAKTIEDLEKNTDPVAQGLVK